MNEFDIIKNFVPVVSDSLVELSSGDDCSLVDFSEKQFLASSCDCLVEDVHFEMTTHSWADLAYKSLAVNISDVAAMGAKPRWVHLTLACPAQTASRDFETFFEAFNDMCRIEGLSLIGGDLSASPDKIFINIHISGLVDKEKVKRRQAFKPGQWLCASGNLGSSAAGLYCLQNQIEGYSSLEDCHRRPPVEISKALFLSQYPQVTGMMDISDGLWSDLRRLSHCGFRIDVDQIAVNPELFNLAQQIDFEPLQWILAGGEDYRLLFSCDKSGLDLLKKNYHSQFGEEFFVIGEVLAQDQGIQWFKEQVALSLDLKNFNHFNGANG